MNQYLIIFLIIIPNPSQYQQSKEVHSFPLQNLLLA